MERLIELKREADRMADGYDAIEREVAGIVAGMSARELIATCQALGIVKRVRGKAEAMDAIRRHVLEMRYVEEAIAY